MGMKDMLLELREKALQDMQAAKDSQELRQRNGRRSAKW